MCTLNGDVLQVPLPGGGGAEPEPEPAGGGAAAGGAVSKAYVGHNSYISGLGRNPESGQVLAVDGGGRAIAWDIGEAMGQECYPPAGKAPKIFTCCATSTGAPIAFCGTGDNKVCRPTQRLFDRWESVSEEVAASCAPPARRGHCLTARHTLGARWCLGLLLPTKRPCTA
eukprot:COSAG01_NODE_2928_length_6838_cov_168.682149_11_plen_170_part_00